MGGLVLEYVRVIGLLARCDTDANRQVPFCASRRGTDDDHGPMFIVKGNNKVVWTLILKTHDLQRADTS